MEAIRHYLVIKTTPEKVFDAITTEEGLKGWWSKETTAKPEVGFINKFNFGNDKNEFKVTELNTNRKVEWLCLKSNDAWVGTTVLFELEEKNGNTALRFTHDDWREVSDFFAICNYNWARFMTSLKSLCETGSGTPY